MSDRTIATPLTATEVGPAGVRALRLMDVFDGELLIDVSEGEDAIAAVLVCITLARDGLCIHSATPPIASFTLTDAGRRVLAGGRLH